MRVSRTASSDDQQVSTAVVTAVAEAEELSPTELTPPLHDTVDPEALDRLFGGDRPPSESGPQVSFTYCGYDVCVDGRGTVVIRSASESDSERVA